MLCGKVAQLCICIQSLHMYTVHMFALFSIMLYHRTLDTVLLSLCIGQFAAANPKLP